MKKTDWTDRMLAALVELYPVETTAYTAAVLNLSEGKTAYRLRTGTHNRYPCHFKQGEGKGALKHEVKRIHHQ